MMVIIINAPHTVMSVALGDSLRAMGHDVSYRSPAYWRNEIEDCDVLFVGGLRRFTIAEKYKSKKPDTKIICIDWGYFDRVNNIEQSNDGHWMLSLDEINNLPVGEFPQDRLEKTSVKFISKGGNPNGYVLIIGQVQTDTAVKKIIFDEWVKQKVAEYPGALFRPHPRSRYKPTGVKIQREGSLQDAFDGARMVVTYNSNAGWEALAAGVPVICDPCAAYAELSGEKIPTIKQRKKVFSRAAYGQWKVSESDEAAQFVLERLIK